MTHPTQEDDVKALKDALALGPQAWDYDSNQTPFYNDPEGHSRGGNCDGTYTLYGLDFEIDGDTYEGPTLSERCKKADAKFIAAANPERIARLLAHIEAQAVRLEAAERDAERYRWLRARPLSGDDAIWIGCDDVRIKGRWGLGGVANRFDPNSGPDACDREIDAAIASEAGK